MSYNTFTLTGTYKKPNGVAEKGGAVVIPSVLPLVDNVGNVILAGAVQADLDSNGSFSLVLPTTGANLLPATFGYTLIVTTHGAGRVTSVELTPGASGTTLNAAQITPAPLPAVVTPTAVTTAGLDGAVTALVNDAASASKTVLSATYEARAFKPAIKITALPGQASGQTGYSGRSYTQDSVCTVGGVQYAAWYDPAGALLIGKRTLPSEVWTTFDLSTVAGNPLVLPVDTDSHNTVSMIVDAQGFIHVAANMHGDTLRYVKSTNANDITAWTAPGMTGSNETQMTYPRFVLHPDGTLFFMYRDGASGNGDIYLNRKNVGGSWTQLGKLADGKTANENPYESRFIIDATGTLAVAMTWRPNGGDFNTNNDVHFIKSTDKGATWKNVSGTAVTIPLVHADTVALVLDTAATNSGIINQFGLDLDTSGRPHIALTLADGATPDRNIHHLYWDGAAWVNQQVTDLLNAMGYNDMPTRPAVACTNDGRTLLLTSYTRVTNKRGTFRIIDVTGGVATDVPVANLDGRDWEMTYDGRALRERNELNIMLSQANADVATPGPDYWDINNWNRQWAAILTVDLTQIGPVLRREAIPPRIRTVASVNVPNNASVTATSDAIVPGSGGILTPIDLRGRQVFARLTARASTTGGTLTISAFEVQQGGSSRVFGSIPFTGGSTALRASPWMPLQYGPIANADSIIQIMGRVSATFTGTVSAAVLELGVMDG